ncbi:MAG TPA: alpha-L-fucosidase [Sedimentisphaerales bacterium]|nr:alpha-L-fucosidase [Sedimentisphaerales bacterium]
MLKAKNLVLLAGLTVAFFSGLHAIPVNAADAQEGKDYLKADAQRMQQWRDMKFGLFVHWGPVSLMGTEIGWSRGGERRGRKGTGEIPVEVYDNLYRSFYPAEFDAAEWVQIAKSAGMKYIVFTTKHHDGFCMFDSGLTDYEITNSPFKRDIVKEIAGACRKGGLKLGFYYSQPDWHHPDYRTDNHTRYIKYLHGHLRELCTKYGKLDIIFFDGLGGKAEDWNPEDLFKMIRSLQPDVVINNRGGLPGDYETPEQRVGEFRQDRPWESCITVCRQWAWKPGDRMKSLAECIQTLVRVVGGDGNLLLNVGPMPTGEIEPRQVELLRQLGDWLRRYGESIYSTRGGPFKGNSWCASTHSGNRIYVHILNWHGETFRLPAINKKVTSASLLTGGDMKFEQTKDAIDIIVPKQYQREIDTIAVLELDGSAGEIEPVEAPSRSLAYQAAASSSSVYNDRADSTANKAFDDDYASCWRSNGNEGWLQIDLGRPRSIDAAFIWDGGDYFGTEQYELLYDADGRWQSLARGDLLGQPGAIRFDPVKVQRLRLNVSRKERQVMIYEFQVFGPEGD